ncbi:MAG TPA: hypothetical protein PLG20_08530 [Candidatus Syntrophosphaera sp.]|nr:hypothetical protein [Candidatus Syntrophosphaera sp.]
MGKITTKILVIRENGTGQNIQKFDLPADDPMGFFGTVELKLQSGSVCSVQIPRQSLHIETISKEQWDQINSY